MAPTTMARVENTRPIPNMVSRTRTAAKINISIEPPLVAGLYGLPDLPTGFPLELHKYRKREPIFYFAKVWSESQDERARGSAVSALRSHSARAREVGDVCCAMVKFEAEGCEL